MNVAWVGDSKAVLCRGGKAIELTQDHSLSSERELARVRHDGGSVQGGRISGLLDVSRALGHFDAKLRRKLPGLSPKPELRSEALLPEDEVRGRGCGSAGLPGPALQGCSSSTACMCGPDGGGAEVNAACVAARTVAVRAVAGGVQR